MVILTGCSSTLLRDSISDVGTATATIGCSVLSGGNVPACLAVGGGTGIVINTVTGEPEGVDIAKVSNEHQVEAIKAETKANTIESLGTKGIIGAIVGLLLWTILTWYLGVRRKRPEEYAQEAKASELARLVEKQSGMIAEMKLDKRWTSD